MCYRFNGNNQIYMSFSIFIEKNLGGEWDAAQGDRVLDFEFNGIDFDELRNLIGIKLSPIEKIEGESYINRQERLKQMYFEAAKKRGYKMLGRIWYFYDDAIYLSSEINQLLEECLKLKDKARNSGQSAAVDKLIIACNEALKTESGIFLGSD